MRRNRTKTDWAYGQALEIQTIFFEADTPKAAQAAIQEVAAMIRRAEKRGYKRAKDNALVFSPLTANDIRQAEAQISALDDGKDIVLPKNPNGFQGVIRRTTRAGQTTCPSGEPVILSDYNDFEGLTDKITREEKSRVRQEEKSK